MLKSRLLYFVVFAVIFAMVLGACAPTPVPTTEAAPPTQPPAEKPTEAPPPPTEAPAAVPTEAPVQKVLLITGTGGLGDQGYNDSGYAGAQRAVEELGVKLDLVEPREIAELEPQYRSAAASGEYVIIVGLGFYQGDVANLVAQEFPDQKFTVIDSASTQPNVQGVLFREQENAFVAGILSAYVTKQTDLPGINPEKILGIVLGIDVPHVRRYAISYEAGAKTIDRDMKILVGVVGDFQDQAKAKELSLAQIDQGADIVYQVAGGAGLGVFDAAGEKKVYAIGEGLNQNPLHPDLIFASTYKRMDVAVFEAIKAALEGTWKGGDSVFGFSEDYLVVSLEGSNVPVSEEAKQALESYQGKLVSGEIVAPFSQEDLDAYLATLK
ncbi:MAG: BMP family ABC transporter substrate-binding protein [Anaerolineales bacterium]|nr:BMP family ABC transporter substrate-binding protein [Anaerolineales bacterium]